MLQQLLFVPGCGELHPTSIPAGDASTLRTRCSPLLVSHTEIPQDSVSHYLPSFF